MIVTLYTINCPSCNILERKLNAKNIKFNIVDDSDEVVKKGKENGILSAPILDVEGTVMNFSNAIKWINAQEVCEV